MRCTQLASVRLGLVLLSGVATQQLSAQPLQLDATLMPVVYDRQDGSHFTQWTAIDAAGRAFDLDDFGTDASALTALPVGAPLRLTLVRDGVRDVVTRWEQRSTPRRLSPSDAGTPNMSGAAWNAASRWADVPFSGPLPVLVIPCAFSDAGPTNATRESLERDMNDAFPGVGAFIAAASGGRASLAGTRVLDWVTIPDRVTDWFVNRTPMRDAARFPNNVARDDAFVARCLAEACRREPSLTVQPFSAIQMMLSVDLGVSYAYLAPVALNNVDATRRIRLVMNSNWAAARPGIQAHELGHTLGLQHTFGPYGVEYDSRWDVMSNASSGYDQTSRLSFGTLFNGWHRMRLRWAGEEEVANMPISAMHDTILLGTASGGAGAIRAARIELARIGQGTERILTIEARRRDHPFEAALPREGVVLHRISGATAIVIDRDGNKDTNDDGSVLRPGQSWEDETEGVIVQVLEERSDGFLVALTRRSAFRIVATSTRRMQLGRPQIDSLGLIGGVAPVLLTAESLPPGMRLDATRRVLIGTPTQSGPFTVRLRATDAAGAAAEHEIAVLVDPLQAVAGPLLREGRVGEPRVDTIAYYRTGPGFNSGSSIVYSAFPPGMTLEFLRANDSLRVALLRGTPTQVVDAQYLFGLFADPEQRIWHLTFRFRTGRLIVVGDSLRPTRVEGIAGADSMRLGGGAGAPLPTARWHVVDGALPDGWTLDSLSGIAGGVAHSSGTFSATVQARTAGDTATASRRWTILPALELGETPWGATLPLGIARNDTLRVLSRAGSATWRVRAGALPVGIVLTTDGRLVGVPTAMGPFQAMLEVQAGVATRSLSLVGRVELVPLRAMWASADTLVIQGDELLDSLQLYDGDGSTVAFALSADSLPPGLAFDAERRLLFGRPRTIGVWNVPLTVSQGDLHLEVTRTLHVTPMASLLEDSLSTATAGFPFEQTIATVVQGGGEVTVKPGATSLPSGLNISTDGRVSGIPDTVGSGVARLMLEVARPDGRYDVPVAVRWTTRETVLDAGAVFDALLGVRPLEIEPARGFDLLGNRNQRIDVGDVLRWLVRRGVLAHAASVHDVMPALRTLLENVNATPALILEGKP